MSKRKAWIDEFIKSAGFTPIVKRKSGEWIDGELVPCDLIEVHVKTLVHNVNNAKTRIQESTDKHGKIKTQLKGLQAAIERLSLDTRELIARNSVIVSNNPVVLPLYGQGSVFQTFADGVDTSLQQYINQHPDKENEKHGEHNTTEVRCAFIKQAASIFLMMGGDRLSSYDGSFFEQFLTELDTKEELGLTPKRSKPTGKKPTGVKWRVAVNKALGSKAEVRTQFKQQLLKRLKVWQ